MLTAHAAGNLGRDATTKVVKDKPVCSFTIACKVGKKDDPPTWVDCELWGRLGESLAQYLVKGSAVSVSGRLSSRAYTNKQGEPAAAIKIDVQNITLQGVRENREADPLPAKRDTEKMAREIFVDPAPEADPDIPF